MVPGRLNLKLQATASAIVDPEVAIAVGALYTAFFLLSKDIAVSAGACELPASVNIARGQAVNIYTGKVRLADKDLGIRAVGIASGAAVTGQPCRFILLQGYINNLTGLTANSSLYLGTAGALLTAKPGTGLVQGIGYSLSTTELLVNIAQP